MSSPSERRFHVLFAAVQAAILIASLVAPTAALAVEPDPTGDPPPASGPASTPSEPAASPEATPTPTPEPTPAPTPVPDPTSSATPDPSPSPSPTPTPSPVLRAYVVSFASGVSSAEQLAALTAAGAVSEDSIAVLRIHAVRASDPSVEALRADARVASVELDRSRAAEAVPSDTDYGDQWALPKIGWEDAFGVVNPAGAAVVAVLDTGVDASHPDLDERIVAGNSQLAGSTWSSDPNGHGTALAAIVAAETDNAAGIAGVGYDGVSIMPVTVLDETGVGRDSDIIEGVVWAADHGADVILMAFSATGYSSGLQAAVDYAWSRGVVLVAAAGNDGSTVPAFPAGDRGVIGVSSTNSTDVLAASSNRGEAVFLAAPGRAFGRSPRAAAPRSSAARRPRRRTLPARRRCWPPRTRLPRTA